MTSLTFYRFQLPTTWAWWRSNRELSIPSQTMTWLFFHILCAQSSLDTCSSGERGRSGTSEGGSCPCSWPGRSPGRTASAWRNSAALWIDLTPTRDCPPWLIAWGGHGGSRGGEWLSQRTGKLPHGFCYILTVTFRLSASKDPKLWGIAHEESCELKSIHQGCFEEACQNTSFPYLPICPRWWALSPNLWLKDHQSTCGLCKYSNHAYKGSPLSSI